jgi:hypothetical protein
VQHRAVLGDVDPVAAEHRLDAAAQVRLLGEPDEQLDRLVGDPVLGVVQVQAGRLGGEARAARRVGGEQVAQVQTGDVGVVCLERPERRAAAKRDRCLRR